MAQPLKFDDAAKNVLTDAVVDCHVVEVNGELYAVASVGDDCAVLYPDVRTSIGKNMHPERLVTDPGRPILMRFSTMETLGPRPDVSVQVEDNQPPDERAEFQALLDKLSE